MSADLLAEFDSFYRAPQSENLNSPQSSNDSNPQTSAHSSFFNPQPTNGNPTQPIQSQWNNSNTEPDDDIWGDFASSAVGPSNQTHNANTDPWESFESPAQKEAAPISTNQAPGLGFGATQAFRPPIANKPRVSRPERVRAPTLDIFCSANIIAATSPVARPALPTYASYDAHIPTEEPKTNPGDVLFDADEEIGEEDDFGDFETVAAPVSVPVHPNSSAMDLLMDSPPKQMKVQKKSEPMLTKPATLIVNPYPYPNAPKSPSFQERNPFAELVIKTPTDATQTPDSPARRESPITAWPTYVSAVPKADPYEDSPAVNNSLDDDWGDFTDRPPEKAPVRPTSGIEADAWDWDNVDNVQAVSTPSKSQNASMTPPTNIPPPSVLLAMFTQLFNLPQSSLFKPTLNQPQSLKQRILSDPRTVVFLKGYLAMSIVCSHVIAGRKLRWKRDTILAQAMKIGPSAAGGKGGMKLTGVDKAENNREEREVADVVRAWQDQVGKLRSAIAAANGSLPTKSDHLTVPEITENMVVKIDGGLSAPKSCVLCGLKREERVLKVDFNVEDSFGEWWVEYWGHRTCRNFWEEHEEKLRSR